MARTRRNPAARGFGPSAATASLDPLAAVERSMESAWEDERAQHADEDDAATARRILDDPSLHAWWLVDAALMRLRCGECGAALGMGPAGCAPCDFAHGLRFAAREPDRPGVPPGNEHAIRVSTTVLRVPHRHPDWAVDANRVHLPLFLAGDMPTRREQEVMLAARARGAAVDTAGVRSFAELAARAAGATSAAWASRRRGVFYFENDPECTPGRSGKAEPLPRTSADVQDVEREDDDGDQREPRRVHGRLSHGCPKIPRRYTLVRPDAGRCDGAEREDARGGAPRTAERRLPHASSIVPPVSTVIRDAFPAWPRLQERLREVVGSLGDEQLAIIPGPERWPLWATIGHLACQRVFWLCDFAGEPGAAATPYPNAAYDCPGDDDLEHVLTASQLVEGLDASFAIVERCLDTWTAESLAEVISHPEWGEGRAHTRGFILSRVFAHDVSHVTELNEALTRAGLPLVDLWR